jgi:hypothetical protein
LNGISVFAVRFLDWSTRRPFSSNGSKTLLFCDIKHGRPLGGWTAYHAMQQISIITAMPSADYLLRVEIGACRHGR